MGDLRLLRRWAIFNAVGAIGVVIQLGVFAALVHLTALNYLAATVVAVEAAVLHNFVWHQRWTWRDRPASTARDLTARLARFHLANGAVSLVGNVVLMAALAGVLGLDPVVANVTAIAGCSLVNFAAGTTFVFRAAGVLAAAAMLGSAVPAAAEPSGEILKTWRTYEASIAARYATADTDSAAPFFVHDLVPGSAGWRRKVLLGEATALDLSPPGLPGAQIHHWVGAVLVPGVTVEQLVNRLQSQAGMEQRFYEDVVASRLLARDGDRLSVFMKLRRRSILTVTYNTEHAVEYRRLGVDRASSRSIATRIAELTDAGTPAEREKPSGSDRGFLWRLNAYWRYENVPGGVLVECESLSLSRNVPAIVRPIVSPIVTRVARESLLRTLEAVRAVLSRPQAG